MDFRPSTPNMIVYDDEDNPTNRRKVTNTILGQTASRPGSNTSSAKLDVPPPVVYHTPKDSSIDAQSVGTAGFGIWTIEGNKDPMMDDLDDGVNLDNAMLDEDDTKILLEKEFDDFYEDRVHKSAGPVVFVSKTLGMLPVIWTEDEEESECKSYFNLYTFIIFIGWVGLAAVSGLRMETVGEWPGDRMYTKDNATDPKRFLGKSSMDTYLAATWVAALVAVLFSVFKCRSFAEVLFGLSEIDAQLELREKHYDKLKRKSLYWIIFLLFLLALHSFAFYTFLDDSGIFDFIFMLSDLLAHTALFVLDLQFLHFSMVLCKRYRLVNKILVHITKPWKTFRNEQPANIEIRNMLQYRFDQLFDTDTSDTAAGDIMKQDVSKQNVPKDLLMKMGAEDQKISKEEENTFILQVKKIMTYDTLTHIYVRAFSYCAEYSFFPTHNISQGRPNF